MLRDYVFMFTDTDSLQNYMFNVLHIQIFMVESLHRKERKVLITIKSRKLGFKLPSESLLVSVSLNKLFNLSV